jgi:hypothetical protein
VQTRSEWDDHCPDYENEWMQSHQDTGVTWREVEEGFQYGWHAARSPRYAAHSWEEAAVDLAHHWFRPQQTSEESSWDYIQEAVQHGWEKGRELGAASQELPPEEQVHDHS